MSWYQLLDIYKLNAQQAEFWRSQRPRACPNDGTALMGGPPGSDIQLYCPFDGWAYPRDYDVDLHQGM